MKPVDAVRRDVTTERVARYEYDGLFRRVAKEITNQGAGVVYRSDDRDGDGVADCTGVLAGDRQEHYYYAGWRLIRLPERRVARASRLRIRGTLGQLVYGTQYIDEPVRFDRNLDVGGDNLCLETGGEGDASYYYHQDANFRVVALTGEDGAVVERVRYTAYGEPTLVGGHSAAAGAELGNIMRASRVGNPLLHQGLFRDAETGTYQNRYRQYHPRAGRFMQRDPAGLVDGHNLYACCRSRPLDYVDSLGLQSRKPVPPEPIPGECGFQWYERWRRFREEVERWLREQQGPPVHVVVVAPASQPTSQPTTQPAVQADEMPALDAPLDEKLAWIQRWKDSEWNYGIPEKNLADSIANACCLKKAGADVGTFNGVLFEACTLDYNTCVACLEQNDRTLKGLLACVYQACF